MNIEASPLGIASVVAQTQANNSRVQSEKSTEQSKVAAQSAATQSPATIVALSAQGLALSKLAQQTDKSIQPAQANSSQAVQGQAKIIQQSVMVLSSGTIVEPPETTLPESGSLSTIATNLASNHKALNRSQISARKSALKTIENELRQIRNDPHLSEQEKQNKSLQVANELKAAERNLRVNSEPNATTLTNLNVNHIPLPAQGQQISGDPAKPNSDGQETFISKQNKHRRRQVTEQILQLYRAIQAG